MLKIGIVGLPNAGKSTLFNALVKSHAQVASYPFTTIEPNMGVVAVPDDRVGKLATIAHSKKAVPATVEFVDIAGLVKGAHKGEGLGNQFLGKIREVDAICFVLRAFTDPNVPHTYGKIDPREDLEMLKLELGLADEQVKERNPQNPDFPRLMLLSKPHIIVANVDEQTLQRMASGEWRIADLGLPDHTVLVSAKVEAELTILTDDEYRQYLETLGLPESGSFRVIREAYRVLDLVTFFTVNPNEAHAWAIKRGSKAVAAATKVHSDFGKHFIRAEIVKFEDYVAHGGQHEAQAAGKMKIEGKEYVVQDGDVIYFRTGA